MHPLVRADHHNLVCIWELRPYLLKAYRDKMKAYEADYQ